MNEIQILSQSSIGVKHRNDEILLKHKKLNEFIIQGNVHILWIFVVFIGASWFLFVRRRRKQLTQIRTYQKNLRYPPPMSINITAIMNRNRTQKKVSSCPTLLHPPTRREATAWKERFWLEFLENRQNYRSFPLPLCKLNLRDTVQRPTTTYISQNYRSFLQKGCVKVLP